MKTSMRLQATTAILTTALLLFTVAPTAMAQTQNPSDSTPTTLYFHIFDTFNKFPINTQPMNDSFFQVGGTNFPTFMGGEEVGNYDFNTIYGFSTAGPVEYDFIENGRPRFHPERGIAADVDIDAGVQPVTYLYVDVRDFVGTNIAPNSLPSFTMRVTVRTGDDYGSTDLLDAGQEIMSGELTGHIVDARSCPGGLPFIGDPGCQGDNSVFEGQTDADGNPFLIPDDSGIVEFAIPMDLKMQSIPQEDAYNVRIDWFQNPSGDPSQEDQYAEGFFRLFADPDHLPRLELAVTNPVYITQVHPQVAAGTLLIHILANSPWGTYDLDIGNATVSVIGPSTPQDLREVVAQNAHVHGLHHLDAEITYLWKFRDEGASNGDYTINVAVPNLAGTATATSKAAFTVEGKKAFGVSDTGEVVEPVDDGGGKDSPGLAPVALVVALLGVALLARRKRT